MLTHSQRNKIAPISVFFLLFISRIVVSLTCIQHITIGKMKTDLAICILVAMALNLIFCVPAIVCYRKGKNPFDVKWVSWFYALYFLYLAGVNISRFSYFASSVINPEASSWIFSVIVAVCVCYVSQLGIEGLSRFSAFAFALIVISIVFGLACNIRNYNEINLYPVIVNENSIILKNILYMTSTSTEIPLFLFLSKKVNGSPVKPFIYSIISSFFVTFLMILFINATMGDSADLNDFPIYTMFQLAKIGVFTRIDAFLISMWIFGIFVKAVLLVYCSSSAVKSFKSSTKCIAFSVISLGVALAFTELMRVGSAPLSLYAIPYAITCVVIPVMTLIFKKRNAGDELIEKF